MLYSKGVSKATLESPASSSSLGKFVSVESGSSVKIVPVVGLEEIIHCELHGFWDQTPKFTVPCLGEDCPACKVPNKPSFRAFIPVLVESGDGLGFSVKILSMGIKLMRQFVTVGNAVDGGIKGLLFSLSREGLGRKTQYTATSLGTRKKFPSDIELPTPKEMLGYITREEVLTKLASANLINLDLEEDEDSEETIDLWEDD